ncbi:imelysin family protein [Fertoeibacter niger]
MRPHRALTGGLILALALGWAAMARADVPESVQKHILPGYAAFSAATQELAEKAADDCSPAALQPAFHAAFDAWIAVAHLRLGPVEEDGRALAIAFWPDPKGAGARTLARLIADADPVATDPAAFADVSVAGRGLTTLERLLHDPALTGGYACTLTRAVAADLARMAAEVDIGWQGGFAELMLTAGQPGNTRYLTTAEARQALFTQLITGLNFTADQRLGRPLGTFDRPRPERAEARLSGRSLRNVALSLAALESLAVTLHPDSPATIAAFAKARALATALADPVLAGVATPGGRLKVEILQQAIQAVRAAAEAEIGPRLGVSLGFNAADGD